MNDDTKKSDDEDSLESIIDALEYSPFDSLNLSDKDEKDAENMVYKVVYKVKTIKEFKLDINKLDINVLQAFETEIQELYGKLLKASEFLYPGDQAVFYHGKHTPGTITWVKILAEETGIKPLFSQQLVDECFLKYAETADTGTMKDFLDFSGKKPSKKIIQECYNTMLNELELCKYSGTEIQSFLDGIEEFQSLIGVKPEFNPLFVQGGYKRLYEQLHYTLAQHLWTHQKLYNDLSYILSSYVHDKKAYEDLLYNLSHIHNYNKYRYYDVQFSVNLRESLKQNLDRLDKFYSLIGVEPEIDPEDLSFIKKVAWYNITKHPWHEPS